MAIMILNGIGMGLSAVLLILTLALNGDNSIAVLTVNTVLAFLFFRLGKGLRKGERQAVYGLCILGGLAILGSIALVVFVGANALQGVLIILLVVGVVYVPPVVSAFRHWGAFK